jgi:hypothetical protein
MPIEEYQFTVTRTADAVNVDISVSRNWLVFGTALFLLVSLKDPHVLLLFALLGLLALTKIRFLISSTAPVLCRSFIIAGIPVFSRRYEISRRARLRFRPK